MRQLVADRLSFVDPPLGMSEMESSSRMNWYCVHSKPKKEAFLARHLEEMLGLDVYFPRLKSSRLIRRAKREVISPLFPGYLFCRLDMARHYRAVRFAPESAGLVSHGGAPVLVQDMTVDQMKRRIGEVLVASSRGGGLRVGDQVRILEGPMQGMTGRVLKDLTEGARVAILLSLLNCEARLVTSRTNVFREQHTT